MTTVIIIIAIAIVIAGIIVLKNKGGKGPQNPTNGGQGYGSTGGGSYSGGSTYGANGVQR